MDNQTADRIAKLEAENAELKTQLAMARDAMQFTKRAIYGENGEPSLLGNGHNARYDCGFIKNWHKDPNCKIEETARHAEELLLAVHRMTVKVSREIDSALAATAPAVAKYEARLKAEGAAEASKLLESCLPWLCSCFGTMKANEHHPQAMVNLLTTLQAVLRFQGNAEAAERFQGDMDTAARAAALEASR